MQRPPGAGKDSFKIINADIVLRKVQKLKGLFGDLGCGYGSYSMAFAKRNPRLKVIACDLWKEGLLTLKERRSGLKDRIFPVRLDLQKTLPFKDKSLSGILFANVLHDFKDNNLINEVLKEALRVLSPKGLLLAVEFIPEPTPFGPPLEIRIKQDELASILKNTGFVQVVIEPCGPYHYLATAKA